MLYISTEKFKYFIPYGSLFLVILGAFKQIIYFGAFNIVITDYLEITEIIGAFLSDLLFIGSIMVFVLLFDFLFTTNSEIENKTEGHLKYLQELKFGRRLLYMGRMFTSYTLLNIVFLVLYFIERYYFGKNANTLINGWIVLNIQLLCIVLLQEYKRAYYQRYGRRLDVSTGNIALLVIIITCMLLGRTFNDINSVKNDKKYFGTRVFIGDRTLVSDSLFYYIGKTKDFVFFYDQRLDETTVYPMSDFKGLHFKKRK